MPTGGVAHGNTTNAFDCNVFYNGLKTRYGASNVYTAGFTVGSDTVNMSSIASVTNFRAAKNLHVLYWSSHGNSYPKLNYGGPKEFKSGEVAYVDWCDSLTNPLKVAIFAACYQFNGNTNRSRWANNVMRRCDLRVMAGYHEKGPTHQIDRDIATEFFSLANGGNSVWYSWEHANAISSKGKDWLVLVYHGDGRQYYRMPGFPGNTYPDPNRNTTPIYRYAGTISNQEVPKTSGASLGSSPTSGSFPYMLEIDSSPCKMLDVDKLNPSVTICTDAEMNTMFYGVRENSATEVSARVARSHNSDLFDALVDKEILEAGIVDAYETAMAEVLQEGEKEGPERIIGSTRRIFQQYEGILLEGNCIVSSSDANGVIALNNRWLRTKAIKGSDHVDLVTDESVALKDMVNKKTGNADLLSDLVSVQPLYVRNGNNYVLQYELEDVTGRRVLLDSKFVDRL